MIHPINLHQILDKCDNIYSYLLIQVRKKNSHENSNESDILLVGNEC